MACVLLSCHYPCELGSQSQSFCMNAPFSIQNTNSLTRQEKLKSYSPGFTVQRKNIRFPKQSENIEKNEKDLHAAIPDWSCVRRIMKPQWAPRAFFLNINVALDCFASWVASLSWQASIHGFDLENHLLFFLWSYAALMAAWLLGGQVLPSVPYFGKWAPQITDVSLTHVLPSMIAFVFFISHKEPAACLQPANVHP